MGKALYRKYRSKKLSEIVGQPHITHALSAAIKNNKINHAYLFTGPRGVGKTSIARILAHEINDIPYDEDASHLDIIEIDAASNRRIEEVRDLREKVHILPTSAKYKVYIIDEVHMLTREAFNALLKTLEEPPQHVVFILATTEAHKLPETIVSRTQRFHFKSIATEDAVGHLKELAHKEKISIDEEALRLLAEHGNGSFRDSIGLLDQVSHLEGPITAEQVASLLGLAPKDLVSELLTVLSSHDIRKLAVQLETLRNQALHPTLVAKQLSLELRSKLLSGELEFSEDLMTLIQKLIAVPASPQPHVALDLALIGFTAAGTITQPVTAPEAPQEPKPRTHKSVPATTVGVSVSTQTARPTTSKSDASFDDALWQKILTAIKSKNNTLYGVLRMARATADDKTLTLHFGFSFHQRRVNETKNKQLLSDVLSDHSTRSYTIECVVDPSLKTAERTPKPAPHKAPPSSGAIEAVSNIFGTPELLDS